MSVTLGSNVQALLTMGSLRRATSIVDEVSTRLSSGMRINRASDDAAGLSIASTLGANSRIYGQAIRNVNDGLSFLNIADGALGDLSNITMRLKELATQSASGTLGLTQRRSINTEASALVDEFNRIVLSTSFNGLGAFNAGRGRLVIQAGTGSAGALTSSLGEGLDRLTGNGFKTASLSASGAGNTTAIENADVNRDGKLDLITVDQTQGVIRVSLGNGSGGFTRLGEYGAGSEPFDIELADFDNDGILDVAVSSIDTNKLTVLRGDGHGQFGKAVQYTVSGDNNYDLTAGDFDGDGKVDLAVASLSAGTVSILRNTGTSFAAAQTISLGASTPRGIEAADMNNDGKLDLIVADTEGRVRVLSGSGNGAFTETFALTVGNIAVSTAIGDLNHDGIMDIVASSFDSSVQVLLGTGNGGYTQADPVDLGLSATGQVRLADLNGDGILDIISGDEGTPEVGYAFGTGNGTFGTYSKIEFPGGSTYDITLGDFNNDGVLDIASATNEIRDHMLALGQGQTSYTIGKLNLSSRDSALEALASIDAILARITNERSGIGADQSRLTIALSNLATARENTDAAYSRIMNADIAMESARLVSAQIRQQAAASILRQVSIQPQLALTLLR